MQNTFNEKMMNLALKSARRALQRGEVPIGAVVVDAQRNVLATASNRTEKIGCQDGHAEMLAIKRACKKVGNWRLDGCQLFVTLQPCMMCFGLAAISRMAVIYYGSNSQLFGFDAENQCLPTPYRQISIIASLKELECAAILTQFFTDVRKNHKLSRQKI